MMIDMNSEADDDARSRLGEHRGDGIALWRRIVDDIEAAIARGTYARGQKLPAEHDLAETFGVNRHTVRRAIAVLTERGIVRATRGSGTYVEHVPLAYPITQRTRFSEIVSRQEREPGGELIGSTVEPASEEIAAALALAPGQPVLRMESLRRADGVPLCLAVGWFPSFRVPDFDLVFAATRSITRALATFGITDYRRVSTRVIGTIAEPRDEQLLELAPGRSILVVESLNADPAGRPIQYTRARFAADRVTLELG